MHLNIFYEHTLINVGEIGDGWHSRFNTLLFPTHSGYVLKFVIKSKRIRF